MRSHSLQFPPLGAAGPRKQPYGEIRVRQGEGGRGGIVTLGDSHAKRLEIQTWTLLNTNFAGEYMFQRVGLRGAVLVEIVGIFDA